ncbi:hypothetical protein B0T24DRAFT_119862 [Lasiosphaeria ovina]|uniref:Rhodopsin domain-containing protein n=1 Tax=Lasiosphaeria ovina TaxID=92902 RepID=A0AAE0JSU1_9PEZI|nr:hypothetical protein B0T24DRAFT_119862 [Lasiosphaeria ovina]
MDVDPGLAACTWILWAVAVVVVACRFASRGLQFGPGLASFAAQLQADDYLMVVATVALTGVAVTSNQVNENGSNYVADGVAETWSPDRVARAVWGSKMLVALEWFMLATLWLVKACLLFLYARITTGLRESMAVKATAIYCGLTFVIIQVLYLGVWCRPIHDYWAVPVPVDHQQCKTYHYHIITVTVLHVSSDLAMLCIPLPVIIRARLPLRRKLVLCGVFSLGGLVVVVAILNRYFNLAMPNDSGFLRWYNAEAATAVVIANVPFCWALLRQVFALDSWAASSSGSGGGGSVAGRRRSCSRAGGRYIRTQSPKGGATVAVMGKKVLDEEEGIAVEDERRTGVGRYPSVRFADGARTGPRVLVSTQQGVESTEWIAGAHDHDLELEEKGVLGRAAAAAVRG